MDHESQTRGSRVSFDLLRSTAEGLAEIAQEEGVSLEILINLALADFVRTRLQGARNDRSTPRVQPTQDRPAPRTDGSIEVKRVLTSKYVGLYHYLIALPSSQAAVCLTFAEIEEILRGSLPQSAREHRPWWANTGGSHVQANAWLEAGWQVTRADLRNEEIEFRRR